MSKILHKVTLYTADGDMVYLVDLDKALYCIKFAPITIDTEHVDYSKQQAVSAVLDMVLAKLVAADQTVLETVSMVEIAPWKAPVLTIDTSSDSINEDDKKHHVRKAVKALVEVRDNLEIIPEGEQDIDDMALSIVKAIDYGLDYLGLNNPDDIDEQAGDNEESNNP
jgi:hypothetical protein